MIKLPRNKIKCNQYINQLYYYFIINNRIEINLIFNINKRIMKYNKILYK